VRETRQVAQPTAGAARPLITEGGRARRPGGHGSQPGQTQGGGEGGARLRGPASTRDRGRAWPTMVLLSALPLSFLAAGLRSDELAAGWASSLAREHTHRLLFCAFAWRHGVCTVRLRSKGPAGPGQVRYRSSVGWPGGNMLDDGLMGMGVAPCASVAR
jgi:hypothetical protein